MLARHLLFLATRRPTGRKCHFLSQGRFETVVISATLGKKIVYTLWEVNKNASDRMEIVTRAEEKVLLVIQPSEQVSTSTCPQQQPQNHQQPPPYVGPPQVQKIHEDYPYQVVYDNNNRSHHQQPNSLQYQLRQNLPFNNQHHQHHHHQQHIVDPYQQLIYEKNNLYYNQRQQPYSNYVENQKIYASQFQGYEKSQQHQQQFYTLPNRRPHREVIVEPPRSITPDITRGLSRGPLSSMHMLAKQGQKSDSAEKLVSHHHGQARYNCQMDLNRKNLEQFEARCKLAAQQQQQLHQAQRQSPVDVKNRFASPMAGLGYRFFATPMQDALKNVPISPIGPEHANGFKSSTPTGRCTPTVAERLALQSQRCVSPNPALMQHASSEKQLASSDSGRSTPTNLVLSPIKSTMSNEELFAAIHKSKKRLNIRDDLENLSPASSVTSLAPKQQAVGTRHSWSPESQKAPEIPKTVLSPSATSRMDFKRLLLQQSIKAGPIRISAAEQLKLSRQQSQESQQLQQQQPPTPTKTAQQIPLTKVLSPRSAWRFQTPRTDVLSSTIIEDAAAEEKAMKPSPETPLPVSRFPTSTRRQLDLGSGKNDTKDMEELKNVINDNKTQRTLEKRDKELENRLQAIDNSATTVESNNNPELENNPIKAIENRRMSNQLARAQFLAANASTPTAVPTSSHKNLFNKRFRARSESPQQNVPRGTPSTATTTQTTNNVVTRSPSAPTLETAL